MRTLQLQAYEGPHALRLTEADEPVPDGQTLLLDVRAIGINYPDM